MECKITLNTDSLKHQSKYEKWFSLSWSLWNFPFLWHSPLSPWKSPFFLQILAYQLTLPPGVFIDILKRGYPRLTIFKTSLLGDFLMLWYFWFINKNKCVRPTSKYLFFMESHISFYICFSFSFFSPVISTALSCQEWCIFVLDKISQSGYIRPWTWVTVSVKTLYSP